MGTGELGAGVFPYEVEEGVQLMHLCQQQVDKLQSSNNERDGLWKTKTEDAMQATGTN